MILSFVEMLKIIRSGVVVSRAHTSPQVRVPCLRYEDTVQLGCRHLGCDELGPLVGVALYLRSNGAAPKSTIGLFAREVIRQAHKAFDRGKSFQLPSNRRESIVQSGSMAQDAVSVSKSASQVCQNPCR